MIEIYVVRDLECAVCPALTLRVEIIVNVPIIQVFRCTESCTGWRLSVFWGRIVNSNIGISTVAKRARGIIISAVTGQDTGVVQRSHSSRLADERRGVSIQLNVARDADSLVKAHVAKHEHTVIVAMCNLEQAPMHRVVVERRQHHNG